MMECLNDELRALQLTYELVQINDSGTLQPVVHAPLFKNKKKILQMWFSPEIPISQIRIDIEKMMIKMYL